MKMATITLNSMSPLLMHNDILANPLSEAAKELRRITKKRDKSDEDYEAISEIEFRYGLYFDAAVGPYIPDRVIRAMLIQAARKSKRGKIFEEGIFVPFPMYPIEYEGPRTIKGLWDSKFYDRRMVGNQKSRVLRTRPLFKEWRCVVELQFDDEIINDNDLIDVVVRAGSLGICDYRPLYGRFNGDVAIGAEMRRAA